MHYMYFVFVTEELCINTFMSPRSAIVVEGLAETTYLSCKVDWHP